MDKKVMLTKCVYFEKALLCKTAVEKPVESVEKFFVFHSLDEKNANSTAAETVYFFVYFRP